jgi:hypothetical protein
VVAVGYKFRNSFSDWYWLGGSYEAALNGAWDHLKGFSTHASGAWAKMCTSSGWDSQGFLGIVLKAVILAVSSAWHFQGSQTSYTLRRRVPKVCVSRESQVEAVCFFMT